MMLLALVVPLARNLCSIGARRVKDKAEAWPRLATVQATLPPRCHINGGNSNSRAPEHQHQQATVNSIRFSSALLTAPNDFCFSGIHDYLVKHSYANARSDDLWTALGNTTGKDVATLMDTWTRKVRCTWCAGPYRYGVV